MARGQIISGDFIVSIAIFLLVIAIVVPLFSNMTFNRQEQNFRDDVETRIFLVADSLSKTQGLPLNWNTTTVKSIGFADSNGRINKTKIRNFILMDRETAKTYMGIGDIEFNISFKNGNYSSFTGMAQSPVAYFYVGSNGFLRIINNSGLAWDLYYGGPGSAPPVDAVNVYGGEKSAVFNEMISNSSGYMTIIIEDPQLTVSEVNITGLQYFLHTGGIVIFEGNPQMISSGFLMHTASDAGRDGVLKDTEAFNSPYNSTVKFSASNWYFYQLQGDSTLNLDIEDQNTAGGAFAGYWNYGIGKIYYITDIDGSINSQNLSSIENIIGEKAEISSGTINNAFSYTKPIVFDTDLNSLGTMIMVIGK